MVRNGVFWWIKTVCRLMLLGTLLAAVLIVGLNQSKMVRYGAVVLASWLLLTLLTNVVETITRTGPCEKLPSVEVPSNGFHFWGTIYQFVPDLSTNESPFRVLSNHTLFGYCMKLYVEWLPNSVNLTIVCDCPESKTMPVNGTVGIGDIDHVPQVVHEEWPIFQLVHVKKNKYAIIYGCKDHGNGSVSEGAIVMGTTVRNLEEYNELYRTTVIQSFWQHNRELFYSMQRYTMDHQTMVGCRYRREYYLIRGTTIADIVFIVVACLMVVAVLLSLCLRCCLSRFCFHSH
uniref:Uncharacterized protein n=3 Tax=Anopheles marajoara TaxID=58244 RepID=A0A2M4BVU5_9DIPT